MHMDTRSLLVPLVVAAFGLPEIAHTLDNKAQRGPQEQPPTHSANLRASTPRWVFFDFNRGSRRSSLPMAPYMRSCSKRSERRNLFPALYLRKRVCSIQWLPEAFRRRNDTKSPSRRSARTARLRMLQPRCRQGSSWSRRH